jgi:hypothetical protein
LPGGLPQRLILIGYAGGIERRFHIQNRLFGRLQDGIKAQDGHW